ncbi:MAG: hypothetical protein JXQ84_07155 [Rhodospirillaceae bacterium]|nr:hypothetical protein [Rhodospirillaceae bacterium]
MRPCRPCREQPSAQNSPFRPNYDLGVLGASRGVRKFGGGLAVVYAAGLDGFNRPLLSAESIGIYKPAGMNDVPSMRDEVFDGPAKAWGE